MFYKAIRVYKYENSGKLIAGPIGDSFFLDINSDLTLSSRKAHKVKWDTKGFTTDYWIEIESRFENDVEKCRIVRVWDERHLPQKSDESSGNIENRIDISPAMSMNDSEKMYVGASNGHKLGKFFKIIGWLSIILVCYNRSFLLAPLALVILGYIITFKTKTNGDPDKIREVEEAKISVRTRLDELIKIDISDLRVWELLDGIAFEKAVGEIFKDKGYKISHTARTNDKGVDLILTNESEKIIVQCKAYRKTIGAAPLRELNGIKLEWPSATKFMLVCLYEFSNEAKIFADRHNIELFSITRDHLKIEFHSA